MLRVVQASIHGGAIGGCCRTVQRWQAHDQTSLNRL